MKNPFQFGRLVDDKAFCDREEELLFLKKQISNGYSVWLYSPRRYGKTSLLQKTFREIQTTKTIYFDLYNIQSLNNFSKKYAKLLATQLFDWKDDIKQISRKIGTYLSNLYPKVSVDRFGNPTFELDVQSIQKQEDIETILNLPEQIGKKNNMQICIAFDEFQEINRIEPFLIHWMRSSFQTQKRVSYIFLGSKQSLMRSIFSDAKAPFYEFGVKMNINPIPRQDFVKYVTNKFEETNLSIQPDHVDTILDKSRCHPHFTQFFASVVWDLIKEGEDQNDPGFTALWLGKIIAGQSIIFQTIYDQLNTNQRKVLFVLAVNNKAIQIFSAEIARRFDFPPSSTLNETLKSLVNKDLIQKEEKTYQIVNPVFKEWLLTIPR